MRLVKAKITARKSALLRQLACHGELEIPFLNAPSQALLRAGQLGLALPRVQRHALFLLQNLGFLHRRHPSLHHC